MIPDRYNEYGNAVRFHEPWELGQRQIIIPDVLNDYTDAESTVALIHFTKSNITKMSMYDMLEHELYNWSIGYEDLVCNYHDNLQFCMNLWRTNKSTPPDIKIEDIIIWVGFRANPGFWYGRGDARTGFITEGVEPYDDNGNFILDSYPEQRIIPNWVLDFVYQMMYQL